MELDDIEKLENILLEIKAYVQQLEQENKELKEYLKAVDPWRESEPLKDLNDSN